MEDLKEEFFANFNYHCVLGLIYTVMIVIFSGIIAGIAHLVLKLI